MSADRCTQQCVRWSGRNGLATLVIERPPLNPLSHRAKAEMLGCLDEIAADDTIRCLILHGTGGRAFSRENVRAFLEKRPPKP